VSAMKEEYAANEGYEARMDGWMASDGAILMEWSVLAYSCCAA
jgi:hypothetical protein